MADISLDELIRQRGLNTKGANNRPTFRNSAGGTGRRFDARQKIGVVDVRQRIGAEGVFPLKDAREKLSQKDARFRIRGGAAGGGVQDARQTINLRKQQLHNVQQLQAHNPTETHRPQIQLLNHSNTVTNTSNVKLNTRGVVMFEQRGGPTKVVDARDRLSLKRSVAVALPAPGSPVPLKITKTIQQQPVGLTSAFHINVPNKTSQPGVFAAPFSGPITKVVQNDSYTAPAPPVPHTPPRSTPTLPAPQYSPPDLKAVSRTLTTGQVQQGGSRGASARPPSAGPVCSPLEGTKMTVNNLHPRVTEEDIVELFCVCGALKRARLLREGVAEVVFVRKEDAVAAHRKYNNRCLDGQPMKCSLHIQGNVITSDQPILLRLSDSPGGGGKKDRLSSSLSRPRGRPSSSQPLPEVDPKTILKALFKSSPQISTATESSSHRPLPSRCSKH